MSGAGTGCDHGSELTQGSATSMSLSNSGSSSAHVSLLGGTSQKVGKNGQKEPAGEELSSPIEKLHAAPNKIDPEIPALVETESYVPKAAHRKLIFSGDLKPFPQ